MGKKLIAAVLSISLPILLGGCSKVCYDLPDGENIFMEENHFTGDSKVIITKKDGRIIKINYDSGKILNVKITNDGVTKRYTEPEFLEEAQKQVEEYLKLGKEYKIEEGLKWLK